MAKYHFARRLNDDEVKAWDERLMLSRRILKRAVSRWDEAIYRYANRHLPQEVEGEGPNVSVNVLLSNVRAKLPFLFYQHPDISVKPSKPNTPPDQPALLRGLYYYFMKKNKMKRAFNRCILDGLLQSYGIIKSGYSTRTVLNQPKTYEKKRPRGRPRKETSAVDQLPPMRIISEGPTGTRVSPRRFLTHPDAMFPIDEHCRWVAHMSTHPIDLVQKNPQLDESWRKKVQFTERPALDYATLDFSDFEDSKDPQTQFVVLFEVWDKINREVLVFADGNFDLGPACVKRWPFRGLAGFPFAMYVPLEVPETFEAMTELDPIINQVEEMDHFRTMQARHLDRFKRAYECTDKGVDQDELDKLRHREDGDVIVTDQEGGKPVIYPIADAQISMDAFRFSQDVRNDIDVISGVSELRRAGQGTSKTATEASIIDQVQQARGVFDRSLVDDFVEDYLEHQRVIMQQWLPQDLAISVVGPLGEDWVEGVDPRMIAGDFEVEVVAGSTIPVNNQLMRAEVQGLVQALAMPQFEQSVIWREVLKMLLDTYPELMRGGWKDKIVRTPEALSGPAPGMGGPPMAPDQVQQLLSQVQGGAPGGPPI